MRTLCLLVMLVFCAGCSNQFAYKPNEWKYITTSKAGGNSRIVYVDQNRTVCENGICKAWVKMQFAKEEAVPFSGDKPGQRSGVMMIKRVDSNIHYNCLDRQATMISYQLYDKRDTLIDSKWPGKPVVQQASPGTIDGDVFKFVCK